jgi:protein SCO1
MRRTVSGFLVLLMLVALDSGSRVSAAAPTLAHVSVTLPAVVLTRSDGVRVPLADVLNDRQPVVLDFIFTSCATICPVMSAMFSKFQTGLGARKADVRLVSISIDPEYDTPARLAAYARSIKSAPGWEFYTGRDQDIVAIQRAFGTYRGEKMSHEALTFLRAKGGTRWSRLDGLVGAGQLREAFTRVEAE